MMAVAGALAGADAESVVVVENARLLSTDGAAQQAWANLETACQRLAVELQSGEAPRDSDTDRLAEGRKLLTTCRTALSVMVTVQDGAKMSALAQAALQEAMHSDEFAGVVVIKGGAASSTQLLDDRPLRFGDPLSVVSTATISYLLVDHKSGSKVLGGGLAHGVAQMHGKIGSKLTLP